MSQHENKTQGDDLFISLLWDDILFAKILPFLSIRELFILRGLSTKYKNLIDSFFSQTKYLDIGRYYKVFSVEALKVLSKKCFQLKTLNVVNCDWLTDELIIPLFVNNPHLTKIILNHCTGLTSVCLQPVIINCKDLKSLSLADCTWLTVGCLESITLHQRNLVEVNLSGCRWISNETALNNFLKLSNKLRILNLSELKCVTDVTLKIIAYSAKDLERLNISCCVNVSTHGVMCVIDCCERLKGMVCFLCPLVKPQHLKVKHRPNLRICFDPPLYPRVFIPRLMVNDI